MTKMTNVDIAIIGGGMVGLTLAAALAKTQLRIAIIEHRQPALNLAKDYDIRVSAINRASEQILTNLGVWDTICSQRFHPIDKMQVWEQDSFASIDFEPSQLGEENLGYIVENSVIQQALFEKICTQTNVKLFCPDKCASILFGESENWLTLESGQALSAKLVIGADGANSWVREQLNIPLTSWDYDHHALIATVNTELKHENIARQIFTPEGPLAFLPLSSPNTCSIVWSVPPQKAEQLKALDESEFNKALAVAFDTKLGLCQVTSERLIFPLKMRYARDFVSERTALIGDAAHTIHPLAGQGVNLGFLDAAELSEQIIALHLAGKDIGERANLRYFERSRKTQAAKMIAAMQGFHDLFSGANPVKKLFRGIGMLGASMLPNVKETFIKQALGMNKNLPLLAKSKESI